MSTAEFAYNTSLNRTTDKSPHEIIYGVRSRQPIDHIPITEHYKPSESKFASHAHELHKRISDKVAHDNANYKLRADIEKQFKTINDDVVKQLHVCSAGPFKILIKLNNNAYVIDLSKNFKINPTLNVKDLVDYNGLDFIL